jgi:hypothetical protein
MMGCRDGPVRRISSRSSRLLGGVVTRGKVSKEKSVGWSRGCGVLMTVNEFMEFGNWFILFVRVS